MGLQIDSLPGNPAEFQAYMDALDDKGLAKLGEALEGRFDQVYGDGTDVDDDGVKLLTGLRDKIQWSKAEIKKREHAALDAEAQDAAARQRAVLEKLKASVKNGDGADGNGGGVALATRTDGEPGDGATPPGSDGFSTEFAAKLLAAIEAQTLSTLSSVKGFDLNAHVRNMPLSAAALHAPDPKVAPRRSEPVLVASGDIPGMAQGNRISTFSDLVQTMHARSRMLATTRGKPNFVPVATLERDFRYRLALDSTPEEVNEVLQAATDVQALVAAGGWCSPSEISYDFYNIVAEDGLLDLPSVGVLNRGGLRFPTSPTIADILGTAALWSWTETQDEAAVDSDSEVKTCARVDCPDFTEVRSACDGLCVTVGNLVDFSYPELVANHIRLVFAARAHRTNQLVIDTLVGHTLTTGVDLTGLGLTGQGATASILNSVELQVEDYRARFRMAQGAILEAIFPHWALGLIRADLANRTGVNLLSVSNGQIADWLNERGVRAQFIYDWQSGFDTDPFGDPDTIATTWPSSVDFLVYAPGTFVRGQGLQLDLGVVRDSVLNEKNDHTAAWMEDCYAIAGVGHEARLVTVDVCTAGTTGAAEITCAGS
jgi:hypothetical protein